jgi:hypothetical protein
MSSGLGTRSSCVLHKDVSGLVSTMMVPVKLTCVPVSIHHSAALCMLGDRICGAWAFGGLSVPVSIHHNAALCMLDDRIWDTMHGGHAMICYCAWGLGVGSSL